MKNCRVKTIIVYIVAAMLAIAAFTGFSKPKSAFAASETNVCLREWNVASGVRVRRPSMRMLVSICAALKIRSSPRLTRHLLFL